MDLARGMRMGFSFPMPKVVLRKEIIRSASGQQIVLDSLRPAVGHTYHVPPVKHWTYPQGELPRSYVYLHGLASVRAGQKSDALARLAASEVRNICPDPY